MRSVETFYARLSACVSEARYRLKQRLAQALAYLKMEV